MRVFVLNFDGSPLMPCSPRTARLKLKKGEATVVNGVHFTIKLTKQVSSYTQDIIIGIDCGTKFIGVSIISRNKELKSMEVKLRTNVSQLIEDNRSYRRTRRRNKTRYRKARFNNRVSSKKKGWLAPSVKHKLYEHIRLIDGLINLLPKPKLILETASFDTQKLDNPDIQGVGYQQGSQYGYSNVREYVLFRDRHTCQCPKDKSKQKCVDTLEVHHIVYRSNGGSDKPSNLITLCSRHHKQLHDGKWTLDIKSINKSRKDATIMTIIRSRLLAYYSDAIETFGYITKVDRQSIGLAKTHYNDAFVIAGGTSETNRIEIESYVFKQKNDRRIQKNIKGSKPRIRKQRYSIRPGDVVLYDNKKYLAAGIQNKGTFMKLKGLPKPVPTRNIKLLYHTKTLQKY